MRVAQVPVIAQRLESVKDEIAAMTQEAQSLAVTEGTVKAVKAKRAELNKIFKSLETQRIALKAQVMEPYTQFEQMYRECVTEPFQTADATLKARIAEVEGLQKKRKTDELEQWFNMVNDITWLKLEDLDIKVRLSDTVPKLKETVRARMDDIRYELGVISAMEHADELLAEYQQTLSLGEAVRRVSERHRRISELAPEEPAPEEVQDAAETLSMKFRCTGTASQLEKLRNWMDSAGISWQWVF